jgi:hypothetical protein
MLGVNPVMRWSLVELLKKERKERKKERNERVGEW